MGGFFRPDSNRRKWKRSGTSTQSQCQAKSRQANSAADYLRQEHGERRHGWWVVEGHRMWVGGWPYRTQAPEQVYLATQLASLCVAEQEWQWRAGVRGREAQLNANIIVSVYEDRAAREYRGNRGEKLHGENL